MSLLNQSYSPEFMASLSKDQYLQLTGGWHLRQDERDGQQNEP